MTKRILAIALVAVFACLALVSCGEDTPATTTPATKAPDTTTTTTNKTETPATTTPATAPATTPDEVEPTETDDQGGDETGYDMFEQFGGMDKLYSTGHFYGTAFETWPFNDNGSWCPRAFFQSCVIISKEEGDFTENIGTDDYEYTFKWYWHDAEVAVEKAEDLKGPYTTPIETFYDFKDEAGNVIYRLQVGSATEGDMCKDLAVGGTYMFLVAVYKGDTCLGFTYMSQVWNSKYDAYHELYNKFWTAHDRAEGYAGGMQTLTAADIQDAADLGFDENGTFAE